MLSRELPSVRQPILNGQYVRGRGKFRSLLWLTGLRDAFVSDLPYECAADFQTT